MKKFKKSIYIPTIIFIYFNCLLSGFAPEMIKAGESWRLYATIALELTILGLLYFTLRRKEKIQNKDK